MSCPLIYISFHTPDHLYSSCAQRLEEDMRRFGLNFEINCLPVQGDWNRNVCQKPRYIAEMMDKHLGKNIVWLDADSHIAAPPEIFKKITAELGCLLWGGHEIFLSTAYFANTPKVRKFVKRWTRLTDKCTYQVSPEQYSFNLALQESPEIVFERLPDSYAYVKNESPSDVPPVIYAELISRYGGYHLYPR